MRPAGARTTREQISHAARIFVGALAAVGTIWLLLGVPPAQAMRLDVEARHRLTPAGLALPARAGSSTTRPSVEAAADQSAGQKGPGSRSTNQGTKCQNRNHLCPTPSPCTDEQTSTLVAATTGQEALGCAVDSGLDNADFLCPPEPLGTSSGFCAPAIPAPVPTVQPLVR